MAQSNVNMSKLKRSFQMLTEKIPQRTICEQLHMGRGVLNRYKTLADSQGLSYGVIGRMSDGEIESFLQLSKPSAAPSSQRQVLDGLLPEYVSDLSHNRYLTIQALHESYRKEHPGGYGYTQFKKSIREYLNMNSFVEKVALSKLDGSYLKMINNLEKYDLLIWDDFGLQPMDDKTRLAMLQILEERYERKSVIIASQLPIAKWYDYIGDPTLADAIMDRL